MAAATVELIPECAVRVATLPLELVPSTIHLLLRLIFFSERSDRFLSVTSTEADVTIVAEAEDLVPFESTGLLQDEIDWRCVRVGEGAVGFDKVGVLERITGPLAHAGIPVLYISTFSADYVLLPADRLDDALSQFAPDGARPDELGAAPPAHTHPLVVLPGTTRMVQIDKAKREAHTHALLRLLFLPHAGDVPHQIVSLTETPDECSLLESSVRAAGEADWLAEHAAHSEGMQHDSQLWAPLRVGDLGGTPLDETGVVATQAAVLGKAEVSVLYLSTYYSDFTLVPCDDLPRARQAFEEKGFRVRNCDDPPEPEPGPQTTAEGADASP